MVSHHEIKIEKLRKTISDLKRKDHFFSLIRLISFILFIIALIFGLAGNNLFIILLAVFLLIIFLRSVLVHLSNSEKLARANFGTQIFQNEIRCLLHKGNVYYSGSSFQNPDHDFSYDMDLFGNNSIFHYINRCATGVGNKALEGWLADDQPLDEILKRQDAVKELAGEKEWCEDLRVGLFKSRIEDFRKEHLPEIKKTLSAPKNLRLWIMVSYGLLLLAIAGITFLP
jgi:hypothetical protein